MNTPFDQLRITDAEREGAVASLGEHYAVGRLTKPEYDERADVAWKAKTRGDLAPLFADLPVPVKESRSKPGASRGRDHTVARRAPHRHYVGPLPFVPVIVALIALTVLTHLPFIVFGLLAWFVVARVSSRAFGHPGRRQQGWR